MRLKKWKTSICLTFSVNFKVTFGGYKLTTQDFKGEIMLNLFTNAGQNTLPEQVEVNKQNIQILAAEIEKLGYNTLQYKHAANKDLLYYRDGQIVARQLLILRKQ